MKPFPGIHSEKTDVFKDGGICFLYTGSQPAEPDQEFIPFFRPGKVLQVKEHVLKALLLQFPQDSQGVLFPACGHFQAGQAQGRAIITLPVFLQLRH